jgi:broad specificity phosphatase PhoE
VRVRFLTHSTTLDNEAGLASGHYNVSLSALGFREARHQALLFREPLPYEAVYSSDLLRTVQTAQVIFGRSKVPVFQDARLREIHYGEWTRQPAEWLAQQRVAHIDQPFPGGESYKQAIHRVMEFFTEARKVRRHIVVIGHRVTHFALEIASTGCTLEQCLSAPFEWQRWWDYEFP